MIYPLSSTGIITYSSNPWRCTIEVDDNISKYYRHLCYCSEHLKLNVPLFPAHISVSRLQTPVFFEFWGSLNNAEVEFQYSQDIRVDRCFYVIDVQCDIINNLRIMFGLKPIDDPHITIGNSKNL